MPTDSNEFSIQLLLLSRDVDRLLEKIKDLLPEHYKITFVARSTKVDNAQLVLTEDPNIEEAIRAIREAK